jgi:hypothetical protein
MLQRKCSCGGAAGQDGSCEECKEKMLQRRACASGTAGAVPPIPPALRGLPISQPGDPLEREADRTADGILHSAPQPRPAALQGLRSAPGSGLSGGQPLPDQAKSFYEPRFGYDFSSVRIHSGEQAARTARSVNAEAFTVGSDIVFGASRFQPWTAPGRSLLAHELAHVVQQTSPAVRSGTGVQSQPVSPSSPAIQRDATKKTADDGSCPTGVPPGAGKAQFDDHTKGPSGTYYIYGPPYAGEGPGDYSASGIKSWIVWRFGQLSPAVVSRIENETVNWGWHWSTTAPAKGCQATLIMSMNDVNRLVRMAGYDIDARKAKTEEKEKAAGLPDLPAPAPIGDGMVVVVTASRSNPSAPSTGKVLDPRAQAEEALDPTSVYNKGRNGATDPPFPISMEGPEMEVPEGLGTYTARLHYEEVTSEPIMLLAYGMNSVTYYWEIFNITNLLMRGMSMGSSMVEEAKRTQELAQNLAPNSQAASAADQATRQQGKNAVNQLSEETKDSLRELRNPVKAAAGGSAIDVVSRAYANYLNLELLPVSAIVAAGGWLVHSFANLLGGYSKEKEIAFPQTEGFYMVRCIAQPGPRGPDHSEKRAASVRAKVVEVRRPELLAQNALGLADAAIAKLQLEKAMTSDPAELKRLDKEIANVQEQTSGDIAGYLTRLIAEKETEKTKSASWRQGEIQREIDALNLRLSQVKDKRQGTGSVHIRPQVAFTSTITGETYPLMIELSPIPLIDDNGVEMADRKKVRLFDATVPDREKIDREGKTLEEAVANVFEMFRKNGDLGPGMLFVRMPENWKGPREFSLRVSASGGAVVKKRLEDLATVLLVMSMVVPGVGEISMALAAGLAAERLISRALNHSLRLDAEAVSDTLAILGAVAQGAQLVGNLRIATKGDAFIGALRSTEQGALEAAAAELQAALKLGKVVSVTSTVVNAGGLIWGDLVMVKRFSDIQAAEMNGKISHSEAARQRADMLANAIIQHGVMLHGMLQPEGADSAGGEPPKTDTPGKSVDGPKQIDPAKAPETIPESELEQRAATPAKTGPDNQPTPKKDNVRARFRTPDNLHDIFILDDGRIFRCSLLCSQLKDWYDPYLKRQPEGSRRERATDLAGQLDALDARAKAGEQSAALNDAIGKLDVAMREFIAPDLARELQHAAESRKGVKPGETYLTEGQVRGLLKFFNLDEIVKFTGPDGMPSAKQVRDMAELLGGLDKFLTPADREALRPLLATIVEGGEGAAHTIDFLGKVSRIHEIEGVKLDLADLSAAFERGDAILDHGPLQPGKFLSERGPYELESGRLKLDGKEGNMPKGLLNLAAREGAIDFVIFEKGGSSQLVLGWEHTGLSGGRASVFGAGRLIIDRRGFVIRVDRKSGHYRPSEANLQRAVKFLIDKGILMDPAVAKSMGRPVMEVDTAFE